MSKRVDVGELTGLTERLTAVMAHEVALLGDGRAGEIAALQAEKAALAAAYASAVKRADAAAVGRADKGLRTALKQATARLKEGMAENVRAIAVAKTFNERLMRTLGEFVAESRRAGYTAAGGAAAATPAGRVAVTLDEAV